MGAYPFFLLSKHKAFAFTKCDDCQRLLNDVAEEYYWNPNKRAKIRRLCPTCYMVRRMKAEDKKAAWEDKSGIARSF